MNSIQVNADHYVGRNVIAVKNGKQSYTITLDGGVEISVENAQVKLPKSLIGDRLVTVLMGKTTRLAFASGLTLEFHPLKYSILDLNRGMEEPVWPQRNTELADSMQTPPEPVERITEDAAHPILEEKGNSAS